MNIDYTEWNNYAKYIADNKLTDWKRQQYVTYMLEHVLASYSEVSLQYLRNYLSDDDIQRLAYINDKHGNPDVQNINGIISSPSSIRYIHQAYDACNHFINKKLNNITIIEIGGGYGGLALIIFEVAKILNLTITKYLIYDLPGVQALQKYYLEINNSQLPVEWRDCNTFCEDISMNDINVALSCYALSEIDNGLRKKYIENLLPKIKGAFFIWNFGSKEHLPVFRDEQPEVPCTANGNTVIRL